MNGAIKNGASTNGELPQAQVDGGNSARKMLFHIGEEIQEKVAALVNSATSVTKTTSSNSNVRITISLQSKVNGTDL